MNYSFHPQAQVEFEQAIEYYEGCQDGLGYDFAIEIHDTIQNIVNFPGTWPELQSGIRRCLARRFPYGVLYFMEQGTGDITLILGVCSFAEGEYA